MAMGWKECARGAWVRSSLLAVGVGGMLAAGSGAVWAQMSRPQVTLNSVAAFDASTWQRLVEQGPRPAAYIFVSTGCSPCIAAFDRSFHYIKSTRKMAELVIVHTDVHGAEALPQARNYIGATRMYGFTGPQEPIRQSVQKDWPPALPYVVLLGRDGSARHVSGIPEVELLRQWLH